MKLFKLAILFIFVVCISCTNTNEDIEPETEQDIQNEAIVDIQSEDSEKDQQDELANDTEDELGSIEFNTGTNKPPKMRSIRVVTITSNPRDGFQVIATAVDPEGDPVNFIYQWKYNDEDIVGATEDILEWNENFRKGGKLSIEVIPYDDEAQGIWKSEGSLMIPNSPPVIDSEPPASSEDGKYYYEYNAFDPDGDEIRFTLNNAPEGMILNTSSKIIEWVFTEKHKGNYSVEFVVSDSDGATTSQIMDISIILTNNENQ